MQRVGGFVMLDRDETREDVPADVYTEADIVMRVDGTVYKPESFNAWHRRLRRQASARCRTVWCWLHGKRG